MNIHIVKYKDLIFISIVIAVLVVSSFDYKDEVRSFDVYCNNVSGGVHPDFKNLKSYCNK